MENSILEIQYADCRKAFDAALASERGIELSFDSIAKAGAFARRLHTYRSRVRGASREIYPLGHELYDTTIYHALKVTRVNTCVTIVPYTEEELNIREL